MPGRRPIASMYSPKEYAVWQKEAASHLIKCAAPPVPFEGPVEVVLLVEVERPKTTKLPAPKADVDNYAKGVLDAVTKDGRYWHDDTQVVSLHVTKAWAPQSGISLTIRTP